MRARGAPVPPVVGGRGPRPGLARLRGWPARAVSRTPVFRILLIPAPFVPASAGCRPKFRPASATDALATKEWLAAEWEWACQGSRAALQAPAQICGQRTIVSTWDSRPYRRWKAG